MPYVTVHPGTEHKPVYQVGGTSFVFFRNPRPDAFDPETGERYNDVIVFWVPNEGENLAHGAGRLLTVLHHPSLRRSLVGPAKGQPDRRGHPQGRLTRGRAGGMASTRVGPAKSSVA